MQKPGPTAQERGKFYLIKLQRSEIFSILIPAADHFALSELNLFGEPSPGANAPGYFISRHRRDASPPPNHASGYCW